MICTEHFLIWALLVFLLPCSDDCHVQDLVDPLMVDDGSGVGQEGHACESHLKRVDQGPGRAVVDINIAQVGH